MNSGQTPKYIVLKQNLLAGIRSGRYMPDRQVPSEHELAAEHGCSRHTVRQAIGDLVNEGWLYRIHGKGTFVKHGAGEASDDPRTIGVITTYLSDYIFPHIIRGAEAVIRSAGYRLLLASTDNDRIKERESLERLTDAPLSGLIVEPTKSAVEHDNLRLYRTLAHKNIPLVMINAAYPTLDCPVFKVDDEAGGFKAARHLAKLGHRRIAGLFKTDDRQGIDRMNGFLQALKQDGVEAVRTATYSTENREVAPVQYAAEWFRLESGERPTALFCYNDQLAVKVLETARRLGLRVPDDVSIIGFDDSMLATATEVKLTSLMHPKEELGAAAARELLDMINLGRQGVSRIYAPELVIRGSTRSWPVSDGSLRDLNH